jgi:crotonobetainyl-CoA:carnitine CoA-transferase CaiB-like acyl-CoA transferase
LRLLDAIEATELANDPRFLTGADRLAHRAELEAELARRFRAKPTAHWLAALERAGVPCGPVNDMLAALADRQARAREMVVTVEHSALGSVQTLGLPVKFSRTPGKVRHSAPIYGEHTRAVLREHGFNEEEIAALEREGAIVGAAKRRVPSEKIAS